MSEANPPGSGSAPGTTEAAPLQFDRAVATDPVARSAGGVTCSFCRHAIADAYFTVNDKPVCRNCKASIEHAVAQSRTRRAFGKAFAFGLGAALAGAAIYYAVLALLNLQIGIVAIAIGYMVGYAIRKAVRGGGRRYQILAACLTYFAIGVAYVPVLMTSAGAKNRAVKAAADTTAVKRVAATGDSLAVSASAPQSGFGFAAGIAALIAIALILPVVTVVTTLPSGLLSAIIIGIGIRVAWRMTAAAPLVFAGPLEVGRATAGAS